jgi:hypothetical protein
MTNYSIIMHEKMFDKIASQYDYDTHMKYFSPHVKSIISKICHHYGIKSEWLFIPHRKKEIVMARHVFRYYLKNINKTFLSDTKIGVLTSHIAADHTTIMSSTKSIRNEMRYNDDIKMIIKELEKIEKEEEEKNKIKWVNPFIEIAILIKKSLSENKIKLTETIPNHDLIKFLSTQNL